MISTTRFVTRNHREAGPGNPEALDVIDPRRPSAPVGLIVRFSGDGEGWYAYLNVGSSRAARKPLGVFPDSPCGCATGRRDALAAIARAM